MVTYDASPEAGAAEHCRANVHSFFQTILSKKESPSFWQQLADVFGLCQAPESATDVENVAYWVQVGLHVCLASHHVACAKETSAAGPVSLSKIQIGAPMLDQRLCIGAQKEGFP